MKKLLLLSITLLTINQLSAQVDGKISSFHLGVFTGVSYYHGDLVESNLDQIAETHPSFGFYLRYNYGEYFSARANFTYGRVSGNDANAADVARRTRNLRFRSPIVEYSLLPEFNAYDFVLPKSGYVLTPFIYSGIAGFWFNPQADLNGVWEDLQPLGTEGQGLPNYPERYSRFSAAIPVGIGVKFKMSEYTTITWEFGTRYTFTDYIDDLGGFYPDMDLLAESNGQKAVALSDRTSEFTGLPSNRPAGSVRASTKSNDTYFFTGFSIAINLAPRKNAQRP